MITKKITSQQMTEGFMLSLEQRQGAIEMMGEQLTQEKAIEMLSEIIEDTESKAEQGNIGDTLLTKMAWVTRQAFLMGFVHGLDLYNEALKGTIAEFFDGCTPNA